MGKKWIISSDDVNNPLTGKKGDSATVYSETDLKRRQDEAKKAGIKLDVREVD